MQDANGSRKQKNVLDLAMGYPLNKPDESIFCRHFEFLILAHCRKPLSIFNNAFDLT